jgi:mono/diheme cytochrome c family protein
MHMPSSLLYVFAVAGVVSLATVRAQTLPSQNASTPTIWDSVYTDTQAKRGEPIYTNHCAFCHGDTLINGTQGPPLAGDAFLVNWKGNTLAALFDKTATMMPSDDPGSLTKEQYADVLAYMLSVGKAPAGTIDLKADMESLKQIRIEMKPAEKQGR